MFQVKGTKLHDFDLNTEKRIVCRILVVTPEVQIPLKEPRHPWEDNIKMDLTEVGYRVVDSINLAHDRDKWQILVNRAVNLGLHRTVGIPRVAEQLRDSHEGLISVELSN